LSPEELDLIPEEDLQAYLPDDPEVNILDSQA
jgi:hypothetical protein